MAKYDYVNYSQLSDDQKVLWWFDEYLRYDLVFPVGSFGVAIERYNIYDYRYFADNYSFYVWEILKKSGNLPNLVLPDDDSIIIPPNNGLPPKKYIITYYHNDLFHKSVFALDPDIRVTSIAVNYILMKHIIYVKSKDYPQTIPLKGVAPYSVVINGDNATAIQANATQELFYSNIENWKNIVDEFSREGMLSYIGGTARTRDDYPLSQTGSIIEALQGGAQYPVVTEVPSQIVYGQISDLERISSIHLIYAKPPLGVFDKLFDNQIMNMFYQNRIFGISIPYLDTLFGGGLGGTFEVINPSASYSIRLYAGESYYIIITSTSSIGNGDFFDLGLRQQRLNQEKALFPDQNEFSAIASINKLIAQTQAITDPRANLREILRVNSDNQPIDENDEVTDDPDKFIFDINEDYIEEYVMGLELMIQEIHACLGASEFATYTDSLGQRKEFYMSIARKLDWFAKAYGVAFNPDGTIVELRQRVSVPYDKANKVTIPDGWTRGQFADNEGGTAIGQTGGQAGEERMGIAYQNRCNQYDNFDDTDPKNNTMKRGDVVLCENFLQLFESYLEDMDKGLNWQEMGTGMLPSADGSSICTYEGMGTLLAEVAYMLSTLSSNIYQTHALALQTYSTTLEVFKGLGLPVELGILPVDSGEGDPINGVTPTYLNVPKLAKDSVTLHKRMMDIIANLAIINGSILEGKPEDPSTQSNP